MATAVIRQGQYIDQYKIDDLGGDYDNYLIYISHGLSELVIQVSSIDYTTSKENLLCWNDGEVLECPDDDLGGGVFLMPVLKQLEDILVAGGLSVGADLTDLAEKAIYLAFWYEYRTRKVFEDALAEMVLEGLNELQQRRSLKYVIFGNGIDLVTAQSLANDRVNSSIIPTYNDLNIATVPLQDRRLLSIFGEVGWFE